MKVADEGLPEEIPPLLDDVLDAALATPVSPVESGAPPPHDVAADVARAVAKAVVTQRGKKTPLPTVPMETSVPEDATELDTPKTASTDNLGTDIDNLEAADAAARNEVRRSLRNRLALGAGLNVLLSSAWHLKTRKPGDAVAPFLKATAGGVGKGLALGGLFHALTRRSDFERSLEHNLLRLERLKAMESPQVEQVSPGPSPEKTAVEVDLKVPIGPFSISGKVPEDRLPGMERWAPRAEIEKAFDAHRAGTSEGAFVRAHQRRALLSRALAGLAAGTAVAAHGGATSQGTLALAGGGAGLGALSSMLNQERRERVAREAYRGAGLELARAGVMREALAPSELKNTGPSRPV